MTPTARRRALVLGLLLTLAVTLLDVAGSGLPARARSLAATAAGPLQRAVAGVDHGEATQLVEDNALLRAQLAQARAQLTESAAAGRVLTSASAAAATSGRLLAARVVGQNLTATGGRQVTLDVGQRDGVEPNLTVISADGLVGRVVTVAPLTSDVRLLDGGDAAVAVRVGGGAMGSVRGATPGAGARVGGDLTLTLVDGATVAVGDPVVTLGSVGGRPYVAGVTVGTVTAVDPQPGRSTGTAAVRPAVDPSRLDVLAVVLPAPPASRPAS